VTKARFADKVSNLAVVAVAALIVNEQSRWGPSEAQAPVHPDITDDTVAPVLVGLAVNVTFVPLSNVAVHEAGAVQIVSPG